MTAKEFIVGYAAGLAVVALWWAVVAMVFAL